MKNKLKLLLPIALLALAGCSGNQEGSSEAPASSGGSGEVITNEDLDLGKITYTDEDGEEKNLTRSGIYAASGAPHVNSHPDSGIKQRLLVAPISFVEDPSDGSWIDPTDKLYGQIVDTFTADDERMKELTGSDLYSVQSFYEHSSFGKGSFEVIVLPCWVPYNGTAKQFENSSSYGGGVDMSTYVRSWYIAEYAKADHGALGADWNYAWSDFDTDDDGYIDLLWQVYAYKYTQGNTSFWWAYVTYTNENPNYTNPQIMTLAWASTNFMTEGNAGYDPHTFIHETGHTLGANDYYDYQNTWKPMGQIDYMDNNVGDQNAYTKFIFGWAQPWILEEEDLEGGKTAEITLRASTLTGDSLVLASPDYNGTAFDEYLIVELVGPYGICNYDYRSKDGFTQPGIRILHVDSRMFRGNHDTYIKDVNDLGINGGDNITTNTYGGRQGVFTDSDYWPAEDGSIGTINNVNAYFTEVHLLEATYNADSNWMKSSSYTATYQNTLFKAGQRFNLTGTWGTHFMPSGSNLWNKAVTTTGWESKSATHPIKEYEIDETMDCDFQMRIVSIEEDAEYGAKATLRITVDED